MFDILVGEKNQWCHFLLASYRR